jgi:hypothetical protein
MQKSENIAELAAALCKAQAEIKDSALDGKNPHFHSEYSTPTAIWSACREALTANGLSVVQTNDDEDADTVVLETTLLHSSGQWITGRMKMKPAKADPQGIGSATTYARRYALAAIVGVAPEDDDAEAATGRQQKAAPKTQPQQTGRPIPVQSAEKERADLAADITQTCKLLKAAGDKEFNTLGDLKKFVNQEFSVEDGLGSLGFDSMKKLLGILNLRLDGLNGAGK